MAARVATAGHMIQSTGKFETQGSCHISTVGPLYDDEDTLLRVDKAEKALPLSLKIALSRPASRRRQVARLAQHVPWADRPTDDELHTPLGTR
jgi:hypothetical protein